MPLVAAVFFMTACQNNDEADFANKAYIDAPSMSSETIVKGNAGEVVKKLSISTARPATAAIKAQAIVDKSPRLRSLSRLWKILIASLFMCCL